MRTMHLSLAAAMTVLAMVAGPAPAAAQLPATQQSKVDGRAVAEKVRKLLNENYVLTELRPKFDQALAKGIAEGRYDVAEPAELVKRINADLATVTPDKHLGVELDPVASKQLAEAPPGAGADDAPPSAVEIAEAERRNHGIIQLKVLPGNIRYLESDGFVWAGPATERAYDTAIEFLAGGDAIIIDMRKNGGGSPDAVRYLTSHLVKPDTPLMTFHMGAEGTQRSVALPALRSPSLIGKPLYVLTSGGSASAAEEFIGHVAGYKLGELVGERTAGAGFRNEFFPLSSGMIISISVGQAILASTGKGWEAVGFTPDTITPVDKALDQATARALAKLAQSAPPERARKLRASAALMEAKINPVKTALPFSGYAGTYGERVVMVEGDGLVIQREGGPRSKLIAIGPNVFTYESDPASTLTFDIDGGRAVGLHLVRGDGSTADGKRTG